MGDFSQYGERRGRSVESQSRPRRDDPRLERGDDYCIQVEQRLEARIGDLPSREDISRLAREGRYWAIGTIIGTAGLLIAMMSWGAAWFGSGVSYSTGTVQYLYEAKKAADEARKSQEKLQQETAARINEVVEMLKGREKIAPSSKDQRPNETPTK